jgi:hypothetical protein
MNSYLIALHNAHPSYDRLENRGPEGSPFSDAFVRHDIPQKYYLEISNMNALTI